MSAAQQALHQNFNVNLNLCCQYRGVNALDSCNAVDLCGEQGKPVHSSPMPFINARHFRKTIMRSLLISPTFILATCTLALTSVFAQAPAPTPRAKTSQQDSFEKQLRDADLAFAKDKARRSLDRWV